jgi:hypothetical protein
VNARSNQYAAPAWLHFFKLYSINIVSTVPSNFPLHPIVDLLHSTSRVVKVIVRSVNF